MSYHTARKAVNNVLQEIPVFNNRNNFLFMYIKHKTIFDVKDEKGLVSLLYSTNKNL